MLTLSHDKKIHENMKVPGFYRVTPDVLLVFISEIADIFQYIYIYIYIYLFITCVSFQNAKHTAALRFFASVLRK